MTPASLEALANLRDPSTLQWYVVALIAVFIYVYAVEIERRNWNLVFAGLAFWGMDWLNEIINGLILQYSGRSALWTAPGDTAYLIFVGLNFEICGTDQIIEQFDHRREMVSGPRQFARGQGSQGRGGEGVRLVRRGPGPAD